MYIVREKTLQLWQLSCQIARIFILFSFQVEQLTARLNFWEMSSFTFLKYLFEFCWIFIWVCSIFIWFCWILNSSSFDRSARVWEMLSFNFLEFPWISKVGAPQMSDWNVWAEKSLWNTGWEWIKKEKFDIYLKCNYWYCTNTQHMASQHSTILYFFVIWDVKSYYG